MSFIEKYKNGLALFLGTVCLFVALYLPGKYALSEEMHKDFESIWDVFTGINWIFLGLGLIFMWGEIKKLADGFASIIKNKAGG